ncbi:MAG: inositol monophosphatase family protein [Pseudomonadota bacterium]
MTDAPSDQLADLRAFALRLADVARDETLSRFRNGATVFEKAGPVFDPVTDADREAERAQRALINETHPDHGVLGEEFGEQDAASPWRWVLDPVDGTRAFMCGAPSWMTLIALEYEGAPVLGVLDQPFTDERWIGAVTQAFYRRGAQETACRTSGVTCLKDARVSTTDPRASAYFGERDGARFDRVAGEARVARFSLDAYAYALLAIGELDLVLETGLQRHDWAALAPVVTGAGGVVTDWRGDPVGAGDDGAILAAATPQLHEEALALLSA